MIVLTVLLTIFGLAILATGALAFTGKLPGNSFVGLHIPEVRKSQEFWTMGHRIAGPAWIGSGVVMLGAALVSTSVAGWIWLVFGLLVVGSLFLLGMGSAMAAHALARVDAQRSQAEAADSSCCSTGGCGPSGGDATSGSPAAGQPSASECASGNACGSCSLNGACEGGAAAFDAAASPALDLDAARRAVEEQDQR